MGLRFTLAKMTSSASTWGLKHIFRRPAANFPGKFALYLDPRLIAHLRDRVGASVCVVGTNGKTTVTNLLADAFEQAGRSVICNRTGANLDSGVATALLHGKNSDWGVFECDELWLAKILPCLQSDFVLLLNLFRDQLDRVGEIDHIQQSIVTALEKSPLTTLVYNCDDPLCQAIADQVDNPKVSFGLSENMGLSQNTVADARMCQRCAAMLDYHWRQYGQLGDYYCPECDFGRPAPQFAAENVRVSSEGVALTLRGPKRCVFIESPLGGAYMAYNLTAVGTLALLAGLPADALDRAVRRFNPQNGRLQRYDIAGHPVLLNLAKNPTGFNQNLKIVLQGEGPKAVAFFINDKEADGRDVSWLWDIDFQELDEARDLTAFAGGIRKNDMQVRLKYAGIPAGLVQDARDFIQKALAVNPKAQLYVIANYTALPGVKAQLDALQAGTEELGECASDDSAPRCAPSSTPRGDRLVIVHLYPTLLNLYGDGGNVTILAQRARWRGFDVEVRTINHGDAVDLSKADLVFLGGGPDREQHLASKELHAAADELRRYVEDDGVLLAICGGFQVIGCQWLMGDEAVEGLGLIDLTTQRAEGGSHNRLVGNVVLESPLAAHPVVGYENHAGRTHLGSGLSPFGRVAGRCGQGNNGADKGDGVLFRNVVGTYLHGPLLAKNPQVADELIRRALQRRARLDNGAAPALQPLNDTEELAANAFMIKKLGADAGGRQ